MHILGGALVNLAGVWQMCTPKIIQKALHAINHSTNKSQQKQPPKSVTKDKNHDKNIFKKEKHWNQNNAKLFEIQKMQYKQ